VFPDAAVELLLRKHAPPANQFSPFYAWDAHMAVRLTLIRAGANALDLSGAVQSVGTESFGSRVSVGGVGYLFGLSLVHTRSADLKVSAGVAHLSSHLTRDLDEKLELERQENTTVPDVIDPSEYDVVFVKVARRFPAWRLTPEVEVAFHPINIRLGRGLRDSVRPVYVRTRGTLWHDGGLAMVAESQHELGRNAFHRVLLALELRPDASPRREFHVFVTAAPGRQLHVSPNIGGLRDGLAFGLRISLRT
jgi:hypothetical protein